MIFKDDSDVKKYIENEERKNDFSLSNNFNGHIGKAVSFKNENDKSKNNQDLEDEEVKYSDFEIMFQDELFGDHKIFKIEEEEEEEVEKSPPLSPYGGLTLEIQNSNVTESFPDSLDTKIEKVIDVPSNKQISRVDSSKSIVRANSSRALYLPRTKSNILLSRTDSVHSITRTNSKSDLMVKRVDSMKSLENKNFKNVLARLPQKSASFLSIPDLLNESGDKKSGEANIFTISGDFDLHENGEHSQISRMPDTPMITGRNLPKFFAETPVIGEYKADTSLQSIAKSPEVIFTEFDFSMPRYFRKSKAIANITAESSNQASKSLPDLHEASDDKMSKRLAKLGSRLKPLIIKKQEDSLRHSQQHL